MSALSPRHMFLLDEACRPIRQAFGHPPYLVGTAAARGTYRDVDVRLILADDEFDAMPSRLVPFLGLAIGEYLAARPADTHYPRRVSMGTDIHGFLESRWSPKRPWFRECEIEDSRNYVVFAVLANVRNGYGFAGVPTHEPLKPIAEPRGLPDDHTTGWGEDAEGEFGDHSFSWLTLDEIGEWPGWDQVLHEQGWIRRVQYPEWLENPGPPKDGWSGGVSGTSVVHADHEANQFPEGWTHVRVSWTEPLRVPCGLFLTWLEYAKAKVGDREGRIVFGFDS